MTRADDAAFEIVTTFSLGEIVEDCDLDAVCAALQLDVRKDEELGGELRELYLGNRLFLRRGLALAEERWLTAHGLAHHVLHKGSRFRADEVMLAKGEREAEEFAGYFFLGRTWALHQPYELAEMHNLPQESIERWLDLRGGRISISARWARV